MAPKVVNLLPSHRIYVEVFGGAANVLLLKPPSPIEVYNDRDGALVNLFETVRNHPLLFLERCQFLHYSRQLYETWRRQVQNGFQDADVDQLESAVRTYYSIVSSFVGDPTKGWAFDRSGTGGGSRRWSSIWERVSFLSHRLRHVAIDCLDFRECIKNWDTDLTLFFLDPPYISSVSRGFYGRDFTMNDHADLCSILAGLKGKWLMTIDDTPELRHMYREFAISSVSTTLSSQKVPKGGTRVSLRQLLISNFPVEVNKNA